MTVISLISSAVNTTEPISETNSAPFARAASIDSCSVCRPTPPEVTWAFLRASPPKATISSECSAITGQEVAVFSTTPFMWPTICGVIA